MKYIKLLKWIIVPSAVLAIVMFFYFPHYAKLKELRQANQNLHSQIETLEAEISDLQEKIEKVNLDPYLYEKVARDDLGIAREGEIVIDIEE